MHCSQCTAGVEGPDGHSHEASRLPTVVRFTVAGAREIGATISTETMSFQLKRGHFNRNGSAEKKSPTLWSNASQALGVIRRNTREAG
jgi:hypothetical protein